MTITNAITWNGVVLTVKKVRFEMGVMIPLGIWCLVGFIIFMKSTSKTERQTFIDDFNYSNIPNKMFIIYLMFCILILHPIAKICEIFEGK